MANAALGKRVGTDNERAELRSEAALLCSYLVGQPPPEELIERYVEASERLLSEAPEAHDAAIVDFARSHRWSVPLLDAACGLVRPRALLRSKLLVAAAVLEASPSFVDSFLPRTVSRPRLFVELLQAGVATALEAAAGLVLYAVVVRLR